MESDLGARSLFIRGLQSCFSEDAGASDGADTGSYKRREAREVTNEHQDNPPEGARVARLPTGSQP